MFVVLAFSILRNHVIISYFPFPYFILALSAPPANLHRTVASIVVIVMPSSNAEIISDNEYIIAKQLYFRYLKLSMFR